MAKQYIPGVSGLLTEPNPVDTPSNTLSKAENVIVEQGGKVQARHGFNVEHEVNTVDTGHYYPISGNISDVNAFPNLYTYPSYFSLNSPFVKLIQYQNSDNEYKNVLVVKKGSDAYGYSPNNQYSGVYRNTTPYNIQASPFYEYYTIDSNGEITKTNYFRYKEISNAFNTKSTFYIQTENGLAEANVDTLDDKYERITTPSNILSYQTITEKGDNFFDISWPAFPDMSYKLQKSSTFKDWLKAGNKCSVLMTFYREMGYSDKEELLYESEPSDPILIVNHDTDALPVIYLDFRVQAEPYPSDSFNPQYKILNQFTKINYGRKFGIRLYRTSSDSLVNELQVDYSGCFTDLSFDSFMVGRIGNLNPIINNNKSFFALENNEFNITIPQVYDKKLELNIGDFVSINNTVLNPNEIKSAETLIVDDKYPSRFDTTDADILKNDYQPARLKVVDKFLVNEPSDPSIHNKYAYSFESLNYIYTNVTVQIYQVYGEEGFYLNRMSQYFLPLQNGDTVLIKGPNYGGAGRISQLYYIRNIVEIDFFTYQFSISQTPTGPLTDTSYNFDPVTTLTHIVLPNSLITDFKKLWNHGNFNNNPLILTRSFIIPLETNNSGLTEFPSLYTNSTNDGADNTNRIIPFTSKSVKYKDFWIYSGLKKPLEAKLYVISQPNVYQTKLHTDATFNPNSGYFYISQNFYSTYDLKLPLVSNSITSQGQRLFIDSPIYQNQDVELTNVSLLPKLSTDDSNTYSLTVKQLNYLSSSFRAYGCQFRSESGTLYVYVPVPVPPSVEPPNIWVKNARISGTENIGGFPSNIYTRGTALYINSIPSTVTLSGVQCYRFTVSFTPNGPNITWSLPGASIGTVINNSLANLGYYHNATIFEQAKLTLRLTEEQFGTTNEISIKTTPLYNRRGYYNKYTSNGLLDNNAYQFDLSLKEANGISSDLYYHDTLVSISETTFQDLDNRCSVYNLPGNKDSQIPPDGRITPMTADANQNIIYNSTASTLTLKNVTGAISQTNNILNIQNFPQPGYMLISWPGNPRSGAHAIIFSYSNYEASTDGTNSYVFKNVKIIMSPSSVTAGSPTTWYNIASNNSTAYIYVLDGSSISAMPLYPYSIPPNIDNIYFTYKTVNNIIYYTIGAIKYKTFSTMENEDTTTSFTRQPYFTTKPHNKKSNIPIATIQPDGNAKFIGGELFGKSEAELLDEYTYSIVNEFNKELKLRGINAYLYKGQNLGEINIVYPDGYKIEIRNDYGNHKFEPNINTTDDIPSQSTFAVLAEKTNNDYESKNEIIWSRREIPEITTGMLYSKLGKNDKNVIGFGANVDDLYIFKEDGIWRATDNGPAFPGDQLPSMGIQLFSNTFICQAENSIQEINDEIIFLSQYGFASIVNGGIQLIDGSINRDILTLLSVSDKSRVRSFVNKSKNLYYCTLINEVEPSLSVKSGTYVFNTRTRQWSFMDEEILSGIETRDGKNMAVYRQKLVNAKFAGQLAFTGPYKYSMYDFSQSLDSQNRVTRASEITPVEAYYIAAEQHTNGLRNNSKDQYDYSGPLLNENQIFKSTPAVFGHFYFVIENRNNYIALYNPDAYQNRSKFKTAIKDCLVDSINTTLAIGDNVKIIDSFVSLFINRTLYLQKINESDELYPIKIKSTNSLNDPEIRLAFDFIDEPPSWYTNLSFGAFSGTNAQYRILAGVPASITFNPESGNSPDTNKLFQEYMIHTETANKGALMSFKTDSQSNFTKDRRFVYDANATNRNVFRTYVPRDVSRGRYLIRQIKHDLPLENLIITGQTIVMRDSGNTRVQKDKDNN